MSKLEIPMYYRFLLSLFFLHLFAVSLFAAFEPKGYGASFLAQGSAGRAQADAPFILFLNPAGLHSAKTTQLNLYYRNFYGIRELNQASLEAKMQIGTIPLAAGISRYGNPLYAESELRIGSAIKIIDDLWAGLSLNGYFVSLKNYGNSQTFGISAGLFYTVFTNLDMSFTVENLNEPVIGEAKEPIPLQMAFSLAFRPESHSEILIDVLQEPNFPVDVLLGFSYRVNRWFRLLGGFKNQVKALSAGLSITVQSVRIDYGFEYHLELGISNAVSVGYAF